MTISIAAFKRLLVVFWALWWLTTFLTDFIGALKATGFVAAPWFKVTNYPFLVSAIAPYDPPGWMAPLLYAGIILWSFTSTVLFIAAASTPLQPRHIWTRRVNAAFMVSLGLWLAFFLADQIVLKFDLEQNHMVQGGFQLLCFMALHLLPEKD
ncbi:hypothetical protein [Hoeflea sp. TYP-13]|uniref:hypothetical protein n=1 Tax=Hoeflea sp. TYP-13 TaxID=3230023 RepID=UPI0034C6A446